MTRVLGIDPGSNITGFGVVDWDGHRALYVESGCIRVGHLPVPMRLAQIFESLSKIIAHFQPTGAAIEQIFLAHSVASALKLGQARGAAMVAVAQSGLSLAEYSARQAKLSVVGHGNADKKQMQYMIKHLFKLSSSPPPDATDALGIALCHIHHCQGLKRIGMAGTAGLEAKSTSSYKHKRIQ